MTPPLLLRLTEVFFAQIFMGIYVYLLIDFKAPFLKWKRTWLFAALLILAVNLLIIFFFGYSEAYLKVWPLTLTIPYVAITFMASSSRKLYVMFNLFTVMYIAVFSIVTGMTASRLSGEDWAQLPAHIICLAAGLFMVLRLRKPFLKTAKLLEKGWALICCMPLLIVVLCLICLPQIMGEGSVVFIFVSYISLVTGLFIYLLIYRFFIKVIEEQTASHQEDILRVRRKNAEDRLRLAGENKALLLKYRDTVVSAIDSLEKEASSGRDTEAALDRLSKTADLLSAGHGRRYCRPETLNTVLDQYARRAEEKGISMTVEANISREFDVNETELAVVLSNALSNAEEACMSIPRQERRAVSVVINSRGRQIAAEITNTCRGQVSFDENQLPVSQRGLGHGIGVKSMEAFCRDNGGILSFSQDGDTFSVRILV